MQIQSSTLILIFVNLLILNYVIAKQNMDQVVTVKKQGIYSLKQFKDLIKKSKNLNSPLCLNRHEDGNPFGIKGQDFTCPYTCVQWSRMCRGVNFCNSDVQKCGPELVCPRYGPNLNHMTKLDLANNSAASNHQYCITVRHKHMYTNRLVIHRYDSVRIVSPKYPENI